MEKSESTNFVPVYHDPSRSVYKIDEDAKETKKKSYKPAGSTLYKHKLRKKKLTNDQRQAIADSLLSEYSEGKVKKNTMRKVADEYNVSVRSIYRLWKRVEEQKASNNTETINVDSRVTNSGRKPKDWSKQIRKVADIDWKRRTTFRGLESATGIPKTALLTLVNRGTLKRVTCSFQPIFRETHEVDKVKPMRQIERYQLRCKHEKASGVIYNPENLDDLLQIIENSFNEEYMKTYCGEERTNDFTKPSEI